MSYLTNLKNNLTNLGSNNSTGTFIIDPNNLPNAQTLNGVLNAVQGAINLSNNNQKNNINTDNSVTIFT